MFRKSSSAFVMREQRNCRAVSWAQCQRPCFNTIATACCTSCCKHFTSTILLDLHNVFRRHLIFLVWQMKPGRYKAANSLLRICQVEFEPQSPLAFNSKTEVLSYGSRYVAMSQTQAWRPTVEHHLPGKNMVFFVFSPLLPSFWGHSLGRHV